MTRRMMILLGAAAILAAALVADQLISPDDIAGPRQAKLATQTPTGTTPQPTNSENLLPELAQFSEIWNRPLFYQDRAPQQTAISSLTRTNASQQRQGNAAPEFTILGIVTRPDGGAVMIRKPTQEVFRLLVGEQIDGWTIDALTPEHVTLSQNGERWQLPVGGQ